MFCRRCGTKNSDDARFCVHCGAPMGNPAPGGQSGGNVRPGGNDMNWQPGGSGQNAPRKRSGAPKAGIIAIVVVVLLALLGSAVFFGFGIGIGGRSYKKTIDELADAMDDGDVEELLDLIPKDVIVYALKQEGYTGSDKEILSQAHQMIQEQWSNSYGSAVLGIALDVSYEITGTENIKGDELSSLKDQYKEMDVRVSAAKRVTVDFTLDMAGMKTNNTQTLTLIKVGRSWYLDVTSMGNLF